MAKSVVLHTNSHSGQTVLDISYDVKAQRVILTFPKDLAVAKKAVLDVSFSGTINSDMAGFYRSRYKPAVRPVPSVPMEGEDHLMFSTQFESCDARRAFPCFDEPNLKASFDVSLEIPEDQTALSNMPEKETRDSRNSGLKTVHFERTPVMSTYVGVFLFIDELTAIQFSRSCFLTFLILL